MSHFTEIKAIVQGLEPTAEVSLLNSGRIETAAQNHELNPFVYLRFDNWQNENRKPPSARLISTERYFWYFLYPDEWDNQNEDSETAQIPNTSDEIVQAMKTLADKTFYAWSNAGTTIFSGSQDAKPIWIKRPWIRRLGSTMSGVEVELRFTKFETDYC